MLGVAVVVVVGEEAAVNGDDGGCFRPGLGDGWGDVGPRALHGVGFGCLKILVEWGFALVFEVEDVVFGTAELSDEEEQEREGDALQHAAISTLC